MTASGPGRNRWCFCTETNFKMHFNVDEPCFSRARTYTCTYTCTLATLYAHLRTPWLTDIWVKCSDWLPPSPPEPTPDPVNNLQSSRFFGWKFDFGMHYKAGADILITRGGWTQVWKMCLMRPGSDRRARWGAKSSWMHPKFHPTLFKNSLAVLFLTRPSMINSSHIEGATPKIYYSRYYEIRNVRHVYHCA